ncbi:MAG: efflux RND transporter permease subunit [Schwartzia sp.]|nr:efflux RND transporter permease subunit [Schwartzia sp. (in: firmicutes)]
MNRITEIALKNRDLVWYFVIVAFVAGIFSYYKLGRMEDPAFTIRMMVVSAAWPGATAEEMQEQVTDKLESKFRDIPGVDYIKSYSRPGQTVIYINLKDEVPKEDIRPTWRDLRNFGEDVKKDLPSGVYGPYYNDRFDDVYGSIYAITGDGFTYEEMRQTAEKLRRRAENVESVQKVSLIGVQTEKVYVETEIAKLAELGLSPQALSTALEGQNGKAPSGMIATESDNLYLRVTGQFDDLEAIRETPIAAGGRVIRLGDIATVERRPVDPPETKMYFNGEPAVGVAISMEPGGNVLKLGEDLTRLVAETQKELPVGLEIHRVSDQPAVVKDSIDEFVGSLREAVIIVLIASFMSLGLRAGTVVALCIPLVLAGTFCFMYILGIDLHKVSLGALIISLGLLVDDAIIAIEMMSVKLEQGWDRVKAACYACESSAKPMLTGTLITCAGFIPVAFSKGMASEFCEALFPVIAIALLLSWVAAVTVTPVLGYYLIQVKEGGEKAPDEMYQGKFYQIFRDILTWFLRHRAIVLLATAGIFAVAIWLLGFVRQEFFPPSLRPEIIVEMRLPEGSSKKATAVEAARFAELLDSEKDNMDSFSYYVGEGAPRFVLTTNPVLPADNYAQFVIVAKDVDSRKKIEKTVRAALDEEFPNVRGNIKFIQTGPPADYPVMMRVSGYEKEKVREIANNLADIMRQDPNYTDINFDWNEKSKAVRLTLNQDKLKTLGASSQAVAQTLYTELTGARIAQYYRNDRTIDIELRLAEKDRKELSAIGDLPVYLSTGTVPLSQVADISFTAEDGLIWRRDLMPTITVQANIQQGTADDASRIIYDRAKDLRENLPFGYSITAGGSMEDSAKSMRFLLTPVPAMVFIIMTLLMLQLRSGKRVVMTLLTAPLGIIGVTIGMLVFDQALGFVADLGVLALVGMIIRNSVILIEQIRDHLAEGETLWDAILDSAVLRFRPIMLTAGTDILGMIPLMTSPFWAPMAVAIAAGLIIATFLTLLVLPVMYAVAYRAEEA